MFPYLRLSGDDEIEEVSTYFPGLDFIPCIPSVSKVYVGLIYGREDVEKLNLMCPNMTELHLKGPMKENITSVAPVIWSNMRKLKLLDMDIDLRKNENSNLDSALTGFSKKSCERLSGVINQNQLTVEELQSFQRQNPSILDLQGHIFLMIYKTQLTKLTN